MCVCVCVCLHRTQRCVFKFGIVIVMCVRACHIMMNRFVPETKKRGAKCSAFGVAVLVCVTNTYTLFARKCSFVYGIASTDNSVYIIGRIHQLL